MILITLAFLAAFQQPQAHAATSLPEAKTGFDSSVAAITDVAFHVANTRSVYDLYRRAAFNEPDGALAERATMFATSCQNLETSVKTARRVICLHCLTARIQPPVDQYRAYLPTVERLGQACAARITQLTSRGTPSTKAKALRDDVVPAGNRLVEALRGYEVRLQGVRVAMGWAAPNVPTPRRGR